MRTWLFYLASRVRRALFPPRHPTVDTYRRRIAVTPLMLFAQGSAGRPLAAAHELARKGFTSLVEFGAFGDGHTPDEFALRAAAATGRPIDAGFVRHALEDKSVVDLRGKDIILRNVSFVSSGYAEVHIGGSSDPSVSISLSHPVVEGGARFLVYEHLSGTLREDDWICVSGHISGAWTTNAGRVCEVAYLCKVRKVDLEENRIWLYHYIPETLDSDVINDGSGNTTKFSINVKKVWPRTVNLSGIILDRVSIVAEYVIDSSIEARLVDTVCDGFGLRVVVANNLRLTADSVARPIQGGQHSLTLENIYGGVIDFKASAVNMSNATTKASMVAKVFRANGLIHCQVNSQVLGAGIYANTIHVMIGGRFKAYTADPGAFNTDNNITTNNRNDTNNFSYLRQGAQIDVSAIELDSTGLEIFGAHDSEVIACHLSKSRIDRPNKDCGVLSIKGICRNLTIRNLHIFTRNDPNMAVRLEFHDVHRGLYQQGITFIAPSIDSDSYGIMTRGGHSINAQSVVTRGKVTSVAAERHELASGMRVRLSEFEDERYNSEYDIIVDGPNKFFFYMDREVPNTSVQVGKIELIFDMKLRIQGGYIKACRPIISQREHRNLTIDGTTCEVNLIPTAHAGVPAGHNLTLLGGDSKLRNLMLLGTSDVRRAVTCEGIGTTVVNVHSDGGVFFQGNRFDRFTLGALISTNMSVQLANHPFIFYAEPGGGFSIRDKDVVEFLKLDTHSWPDRYHLGIFDSPVLGERLLLSGGRWMRKGL